MLKKILPWAVLLVVLFLIVRNPAGAARSARHLGSGLASAADAIGRFFANLAGGK